MDESAADEDVAEGAGEGVLCCGIRTQTTHHPRLVLQMRSCSRGLERVSVYVVRRRWWMARLSMRDQAVLGFDCGDGVRCFCFWSWWVGASRAGMLGIEERIVRFEGS